MWAPGRGSHPADQKSSHLRVVVGAAAEAADVVEPVVPYTSSGLLHEVGAGAPSGVVANVHAWRL